MKSFGPFVPMIKTETGIILDIDGVVSDFTYTEPISKRLAGEIMPDDSVLTVPSFVTSFILKKRNTYEGPNPETRYRPSGDFVKEAVINNLTHRQNTVLAVDGYYESSGGQLLLSLGLSLVSEFNLEKGIRKIAHRMRKGEPDLMSQFDSVKEDLTKARKINEPYKLKANQVCSHCPFRSPFAIVLQQHLEVPHRIKSKFYTCNWCDFRSRDSSQIVCHNYVAHQKYRCKIDKPIQLHWCRYCPFETNSKRKYTSHIGRCEVTFRLDSNLKPDQPDDYPGITSKCVTSDDIKTYEATLKSLRLAAYNPHQIKVSSVAGGKNGLPILLIPKSSPAANILNQMYKQSHSVSTTDMASVFSNPATVIGQGSNGNHEDRLASVAGINQPVSSDLLRLLAINSSANNQIGHTATIKHHPRPQSVFVNGMSVAKNTQNVVMPPTPCREQH